MRKNDYLHHAVFFCRLFIFVVVAEIIITGNTAGNFGERNNTGGLIFTTGKRSNENETPPLLDPSDSISRGM
jgi:hypothetical protein